MNWVMFALVVPCAIAAAIADLFTVYFVSQKTEWDRRVLLGPLQQTGPFALATATFLISSVGSVTSFFLFMMHEPEEYASLCIFCVWSVSSVVCNWALLGTRRHIVLACLLTNVVCGIALFVYTGVVFDLLHTSAQQVVVLISHCCNAVGVFHVTIVDLVIWYDGWASHLRAREPELIVVWAGEPDHAPAPGSKALADQMRL